MENTKNEKQCAIHDVSDSKTQKNLWQNIFKELPYLSDKDNLKIYIKHLTDNYILTKK